MNRKSISLILMVCILVASVALAREAPEVTRIETPVIQTLNPAVVGGQIVGNFNEPAYLIQGWFTGDEEYKYLFDPTLQVDCPDGFLLTGVHMVVNFDETMVPVTFEAWVDLEDAMWDPDLDCWVPGIEDCRSDTYTVTIDTPGTYDIGLPIDCLCAYLTDPRGMPYMYMLSMHFIGRFPMNLIMDDTPTPCTAYCNWGLGWVDLYGDFSRYGNILMYGDVVCCDDPLPFDVKTWSEIKSLYR